VKSDGAPCLRYELYGLCVHLGSSMKSGHYVAFVNSGPSLERESWFEISDAKRKSCTRAEVLKAEAYVAFYRREGSGVAADDAIASYGAAAAKRAEERAEDDSDGDEGPSEGEGD